MSRGNRDGRPIFTRQDMEQMGYVACIEAQVMLLPAFIAQQTVRARKDVEDLIRLEQYYAIEAETVENV
jgi:hypothetical protein